MPQFEIKESSPEGEVRRVRARTPEDAAREWFRLSSDVKISLEKVDESMDELEGWRVIRVHGHAKGYIRPFQRMRFRRD